MISYFQDYVTIGAVLGFGLFLVVLLLGVASVLRPNKPYAEKLQTYECGVDPVGTGWSQTYVRYYIFGLLFVIFDVEAVFIFPWAINLEKLGYFGLIEMFVFIFILLIDTARNNIIEAVEEGLDVDRLRGANALDTQITNIEIDQG